MKTTLEGVAKALQAVEELRDTVESLQQKQQVSLHVKDMELHFGPKMCKCSNMLVVMVFVCYGGWRDG